MDPVSAIGLLGSIASLITFTGEAIQLARSFKDGDHELGDLLNHLSLFEVLLKGFDRIFGNRQVVHRISTDTVKKGIKESLATLSDLQSRLRQISRSESSTIRRLRWAQHKSNLERITNRIKGQCVMLHSLVSVAQMEMTLAMCSQSSQLHQILSSVGRGMDSSASRDLPVLHVPTDPAVSDDILPVAFQEDSVKAVPSSDTSLLAPGRWDRSRCVSWSAGSSIGSSTTPATSIFSTVNLTGSLTTAPDHDENNIVRQSPLSGKTARDTADALVIRRACRFDCFCCCHRQTIQVPNEVFSRFSSPIFQPSRGPRIECSEPDCAGVASLQTRIVPPSFFRRALYRLASLRGIKVNYSLNTYRMVPEGSDALRYVKHGNLDKLKLSISSREASPWDTAPDGWSLLHTAVYARQLPTVKYLRDIGVDTEVADLGARKPIDLAILKSLAADATDVEREIVRILAKDDGYLEDFEFTPIHIAVLDHHDPSDREKPKLEDLIEFVDNANNAPPGTNWTRWKMGYQKRSPLYLAIIEQFRVSALESDDTCKVIHNLLDQKDRNLHWTPLHWAAVTNRADKMRILVEHGADPFILSNLSANIIHAAVESDALQSLAYALEISKCHPDQLDINQANVWGESPLMMAAQGCLVQCVEMLLVQGADRGVRQENQQVALHYAGLSTRGEARRQTITLLCGDGAQHHSHINAQDEDGRPPIFDLVDDPVCVEELIRNGADVDLLDHTGKSVFHHACIQDESETLKTLIRLCPASITLRQKDHDGNTPLIAALKTGSIRSAIVLLDKDDVGDIYGADGWAAVHYSTKLGDPKLLEKVLQHSTYRKGMRTRDGKTASVVAMESGTWCGRVKELLREYNSLV